MEALQAQYDAQREGRPLEPGAALGGEQTLRAELGDAEYERYLTALDGGRRACPCATCSRARRPSARASSPATRSSPTAASASSTCASLNALTLEGTPGESVVVEVRRDGQNVQLVMPRGPIGILGGGFRGR